MSVSKQIGRQISKLKSHTDKIGNINHQDKLDQLDIQAIVKLGEIWSINKLGDKQLQIDICRKHNICCKGLTKKI